MSNRKFSFRGSPHFPKKLTVEFLFVDLVNNLEELAEDHVLLLERVNAKTQTLDLLKFKSCVDAYGNAKAKRYLSLYFSNISSGSGVRENYLSFFL